MRTSAIEILRMVVSSGVSFVGSDSDGRRFVARPPQDPYPLSICKHHISMSMGNKKSRSALSAYVRECSVSLMHLSDKTHASETPHKTPRQDTSIWAIPQVGGKIRGYSGIPRRIGHPQPYI